MSLDRGIPGMGRMAPAIAFWLLFVALAPLLLVQGVFTVLRTPRLPEAAGARQGQASASEPADAPSFRLLLAGESTAVGVGAPQLTQALAGQLATAIATRCGYGVRWQVVGANGARMRHVAEVLRGTASPETYDLALVPMGVNDTVKLTSLAGWRAALQQITAALRDLGARRIAFASVPPVGWFTALPRPLRWLLGLRARLLDHALREWCACAGDDVAYLPVRFPARAELLACDGYHPSPQGYRVWALLLLSQLAVSGMLPADPVQRNHRASAPRAAPAGSRPHCRAARARPDRSAAWRQD